MPTKKSPCLLRIRKDDSSKGLEPRKKSPQRSRQKSTPGVSFSRPIIKPKSDFLQTSSSSTSILKSVETTPVTTLKPVRKTRSPRIVLSPEEKIIVQACKAIHPKRKYNQSQWLEQWKETKLPFFSRFQDVLPSTLRVAVLNPDRRYLVDLNSLRTIDASDEERVRYYAHLAEECIWNMK